MAERAFSIPALDSRRHAGRVAAVLVGAIIALAATTCSAAPSGSGPIGHGPPPVTVLKHGAGTDNGDIFIAPQAGGYASGPEILTDSGKVIWFDALPAAEMATDFRTQTYQGRPVLTWFQGMGPDGTDYIYDDRYQQIGKVKAGNGYLTDFHEFLITPWNPALILADAFGTANLTSIGGPADQKVFDGVVQEIDIPTGKMLFQMEQRRPRSLPIPQPAACLGDRLLGLVPHQGEIFAFQHDPEAIGNGAYTFSDNESDGSTKLLPHSRVVTVKLDRTTRVATLVKSVDQPEGRVALAEGNAQIPRNGDVFVGWGALPYLSEFSLSGQLLFNAKLPAGVSTYRAYRLPWHPASE